MIYHQPKHMGYDYAACKFCGRALYRDVVTTRADKTTLYRDDIDESAFCPSGTMAPEDAPETIFHEEIQRDPHSPTVAEAERFIRGQRAMEELREQDYRENVSRTSKPWWADRARGKNDKNVVWTPESGWKS